MRKPVAYTRLINTYIEDAMNDWINTRVEQTRQKGCYHLKYNRSDYIRDLIWADIQQSGGDHK